VATAGAIVVNHSMAMIRELCTSAMVLEKGRLRYFEDVEEGIAWHSETMAS